MFRTQADTADGSVLAISGGRSWTRYALFPFRITRMTLRRALAVLRPIVVSTPYPAGDRIMAKGSIAALSRAPPLAVLLRRLCLGACFPAAASPAGTWA